MAYDYHQHGRHEGGHHEVDAQHVAEQLHDDDVEHGYVHVPGPARTP